MKALIRLRRTFALQRLLGCKNFHDVSNANVIRSKVDRSSKEFQVRFEVVKYSNIYILYVLIWFHLLGK